MKKIAVALSLLAAVAGTPAVAAEALLEGDPATWRLQNYVPNNIMVFFTGSPCQYGRMQFSSAATVQDKDRFFSMVLTARSTGRKMGVYYDDVSCDIWSFYLM
jgi:hypothetical protein